MKKVARIVIIVILLCNSSSQDNENSWEKETLPDHQRKDIEWIKSLHPEKAISMEIRYKKEQYKQKKKLEEKDRKLQEKDRKLDEKDRKLDEKDRKLQEKDRIIYEEESKKTFRNFICAVNIMKFYMERVWGKGNKTDGVHHANQNYLPNAYTVAYKNAMHIHSCIIYNLLKCDEEHKFPKEIENFRRSFIESFQKWYCYLRERKTLRSQNITMELMLSPLYKNNIYKTCGTYDFIVDYAFSLVKLHLLCNFIKLELMDIFFARQDARHEKDLMELLEEEMSLRGVNKWYFPLKYLIHMNILLKSYDFEPLEYVYAPDGDNIIPQSEKCPRYKSPHPGTTPHLPTTINTATTPSST